MNEDTTSISLLPPLISHIRKQQPLIHHITNIAVITAVVYADDIAAAARQLSQAIEREIA